MARDSKLEDLLQLDKQGVFNEVVKHSRTMKRKCETGIGGKCLYRSTKRRNSVNACFVGGTLIPDVNYKMTFDTSDFSGAEHVLPGLGYSHEIVTMAKGLQRIHDNSYKEYWEGLLSRFAKRYNLTMPPLESPLESTK